MDNIKLPAEFRSGNSVPVERATITRERMVEILQEAAFESASELALDALRDIMNCPYSVDRATVPSLGVEINPSQVIVNFRVSLDLVRKARGALDAMEKQK